MVGAVFHGTAVAQVRDTTARRDTIPRRDTTVKRDTTRDVRVSVPAREDSLLRRDSLVRRDSIRALRPPRDTIMAPLASAESPLLADPNGSIALDRRDMFSTGALTVQDLLDRIPGVTGLRTGWISHPMSAAFLGDPGRVRVFLDGLELEELDPRMRPIWDLTQIPLWALDDIRIERTASEIRIHMRSWRVNRTTPYTRTDVYTGDQATNLYRGLFGRRYQHGEVLQVAGQQYGSDPGRLTESSDQLGALARLGLARPGWSIDAFLLRNDRNRGQALTQDSRDTLPHTESTRTDVYARMAWGSPDTARGLWAQALASTSKYAFGGAQTVTGAGSSNAVSTDTTRSRSQYLLTGGYTIGPLRASLSQRYRVGLNYRIATPAVRMGYDTKLVTVSASGEGRGVDSTRRFDASAVVRPLTFLFLAGAMSSERHAPVALSALDSANGLASTFGADFLRGEAGLRLLDVWLSGGIMRRDPVHLDAPLLYRSSTEPGVDLARDAMFAAVRGRVWKSLFVDAQAIQWSDTAGFYRPRHQTRAEIYVSTSMLERFPTRNFHLLASAVHEYRSAMFWPDTAGVVRLQGYRTISTLLQVRILTAEVFWNFRNILGERYEHVPGHRLPRMSNVYGVRWEFWN